jgi:4-hydroxy-3-polyprenylbenzoate decarboxylase
MKYSSLRQCVSDLERTGRLVSIEESVDPNLEMAAIHLRVFRAGGPALLFKNVKNSPFPAVSNLFGTRERTEFIFRSTLSSCRKIMNLKKNPASFFSSPLSNAFNLKNAFPKKTGFLPVLKHSTPAHSLPAIKSWPKDGGGFMTLPLVYSEDPTRPGIRFSNLGMYRIQMNGNDYEAGKEFGLHYQIHRGIGIHQTKAKEGGAPLKVSVFAGGPPSFTLAAVMPLPEDLPEIAFAGLLGGRRFRYNHKQGFFIPGEADFLITGTVDHDITKPEGPFGDHLGYYSLKHPYPVLKIENVYHRSGAIWPFTVVGRPPMEDSIFGWLIHELTGDLIPSELPGVREVNAVDEAGVHPLLLAIGKERYTPFENKQRPMELLTQIPIHHRPGGKQKSLHQKHSRIFFSCS